jgi:hypothetical protein
MHRNNRDGFAIPLSILLVGFLAAGLLAAYARADNELSVTRNRGTQVDAYSLAQSGLQRFKAQRTQLGFTSTPPIAAESTRINFPGGYADVILSVVRDSFGINEPTYLLRSRGVTTAAGKFGSAQHTVAQYMRWSTGSLNVLGGWTTLGGFDKSGGSGSMSGVDRCGRKGTVAGVAVGSSPGYTGATGPATGSPPINNSMTTSQMGDALNIDWAGIRNGGAIPPDITYPAQPWPSFASPSYYPVILVTGDLTLATDGRGILIVTGNLFFEGGADWSGIVLVGGILRDNGSGSVYGATVSGLNATLPGWDPTTISGDANGTKIYQFDSCEIAKASRRFGSLTALENTWIDNWAW